MRAICCRHTGPVLLLIPGGPADGGIFALIVDLLAANYTVVRYDPRGFSRSRLNGPAEDVAVEVHADDAQLLLAALSSELASVFGSSGGAVIGLSLVERQPELVRTLVAHEPPLRDFLPVESARRKGIQAIYDTYRKEGAGPAFQQFAAVAGLDEPELPSEMTPEMQEAMARLEQNTDFFFLHYLLPITSYAPDIAALQAAPSRVVVGVGEESGGQFAHESALGLAERLGTDAVTFPGGHGGDVSHPECSPRSYTRYSRPASCSIIAPREHLPSAAVTRGWRPSLV
jgi:pimeloyl-ACP methyl ester carboxylesterase